MSVLNIILLLIIALLVMFFFKAAAFHSEMKDEIAALELGNTEIEESYQMQILTLEETVDALRAAILGQEEAHAEALQEERDENHSLSMLRDKQREFIADASVLNQNLQNQIATLKQNLATVQANADAAADEHDRKMLPQIGRPIQNTV